MQQAILREYELSDAEAVLRAYGESFEPPTHRDGVTVPLVRDVDTWRWLFHDNPAGARVMIATVDGRVASLVAGTCQRMLVEGEPRSFCRIVDVRLDARLRRSLRNPGLLERTFVDYAGRYCSLEDQMCLWGYPTPAAWRVGNWRMDVKAVRTQLKLVAELERVEPRLGPTAVDVERVAAVPAEVDGLFERASAGRGVVAVRDAASLAWRFQGRPGVRYELGVARRRGELAGLAVFRRGPLDDDEDLGLVCDWLVPPADTAAADALLAWCVERARAGGVERIATLLPERAPEWRYFQSRGLVALRLRERFLLAFRGASRRHGTHWLARHWHYTLGDTDFC